MLGKPRNRKFAAVLAFAGVLPFVPAGLHKFYLGQRGWGFAYLLLGLTPAPTAKVAGVIEGIWYLYQSSEEFDRNFNQGCLTPETTAAKPEETVNPAQVGLLADAVRQLDKLRQDGLITEYEFEQKRRQLLDRIG